MPEEKQKIRIVSKEDLEISYFCGSGPGGQAKNKTASGVQIKHTESGAIGRASDSRSQADNKKAAFTRLLKDPKMKFWINRKLYEIRQHETIEQTIEKDMDVSNLKFEVKDEDGKWKEVSSDYFSANS